MLPRIKFRLVTLFAAVALVACGLAALQRWVHVPMRTGTMYTAIAYRRDWERLASSRPAAEKQGDFTMHAFGPTAPQELFKDFPIEPQLWAEISVPRLARQPLPFRFHWGGRTRLAYSPMGGSTERRGPDDEWVIDQCRYCGRVFEESALPPKRYLIECVTELMLGIRFSDPQILGGGGVYEVLGRDGVSSTGNALRSRLRYDGPARGLMVFSRPIDDELVQLLILDMR